MANSTENECFITPSTSFNGEIENEKKIYWVPDEEVTNCYNCNVLFNVRIRKHHCRACGNVFCSNCSDNKLKISEYSYSEKVRVCDKCFMERSSPHTFLLQEDLGARKQINQDLKKALSEKMAIVERFKTFLIEFDSEILNNESLGDTSDVISLLKRGENGLKTLNAKIKTYDTIIQKQKKELEELKIEKEKKNELSKILNIKNEEINQKNINIKNLIKEKNDLIMLKEESESIIESYKNQVKKLIIRCNKLEEEKKNINKSNSSKYYSINNSIPHIYNSNNSKDDMHISYLVAEGPTENVEDENCCNRCQRRVCSLM